MEWNQHELEAELALRRGLEDALRESEERFRAMFDNAPVAMALGDLRGRCLMANKAACDFVGLAPEEVVGKSIEDIVYPEDLPLTAELLPQLMMGLIPSYTVTRRY